MQDKKVKQIIAIRKDLKMRLGKSIAQGAHASLMAFTTMYDSYTSAILVNWPLYDHQRTFEAWHDPINGYRKIVLGVNSEEELMTIYKKAQAAGLNVAIV